MRQWLMDYVGVDFWMKTQHIYRSTFTFLTLPTSPHLVFSPVLQNKHRGITVSFPFFPKAHRAARLHFVNKCASKKCVVANGCGAAQTQNIGLVGGLIPWWVSYGHRNLYQNTTFTRADQYMLIK